MNIWRALSAIAGILALVGGQAGACAGWMPTAEARMACCSGMGPCQMHPSESDRGGPSSAVSQAEADRCCAASEQTDSVPSPSVLAFSLVLAVVTTPVPSFLAEPAARAVFWRTAMPVPEPRVARHVLLSVFLV